MSDIKVEYHLEFMDRNNLPNDWRREPYADHIKTIDRSKEILDAFAANYPHKEFRIIKETITREVIK